MSVHSPILMPPSMESKVWGIGRESVEQFCYLGDLVLALEDHALADVVECQHDVRYQLVAAGY